MGEWRITDDLTRHVRRPGFSLVEVLVIIGILAILMGLLFPAIQLARESSRNAACKNNLRQIGLAIASHESTYSAFPSGGWGFQWVGDPNRGSGREQPGSWLYTLLPYLDEKTIQDIGLGMAREEKAEKLGKMLQMPVPVMVCPSRRRVGLKPFLGQSPLRNAVKPSMAFKSDYAGSGGDVRAVTGSGPDNDAPDRLAAYRWPSPEKATGIFFAGSRVRSADVTDGLANTYVAGEKYVRIREAKGPQDRDFGDDQAAFIGDDRDVRRWTAQPPHRDEWDVDLPDQFGSRHAGTWNASFGDGSVRGIAFNIEVDVHRALGNRRDGEPRSVP